MGKVEKNLLTQIGYFLLCKITQLFKRIYIYIHKWNIIIFHKDMLCQMPDHLSWPREIIYVNHNLFILISNLLSNSLQFQPLLSSV